MYISTVSNLKNEMQYYKHPSGHNVHENRILIKNISREKHTYFKSGVSANNNPTMDAGYLWTVEIGYTARARRKVTPKHLGISGADSINLI